MMEGDQQLYEDNGHKLYAVAFSVWSNGMVVENSGSREPVLWVQKDDVWVVSDEKPFQYNKR